MEASHTEVRGNYTIKIIRDEDPINPRENGDCCAKMICFHRRYKLGDEHSMSIEEAKALEERKDVVSLPLYLYDHSGITMNTTGFSCPWDSGKVGFIYVTKETAIKEWGKTKFTKKVLQHAVAYMKAVIQEYDDYLTGNVYGYSVEPTEDNDKAKQSEDSCWGFYGDYKAKGGCLEQARSSADFKSTEDAKYSALKAEQSSSVLEAGLAV